MAELFGWAALLRLSSPPCCPGHLRLAPCLHRHACHDITPTCFRDMAMMQPSVDLPGYNKECGAATQTTATPLSAFGVSAVHPCHVPPGHNRQSTNSATSSGHHRTSADVGIGICRDLKLPCVQFDYRVNGITALSARWGVGQAGGRGGGGYIFRSEKPRRAEKSDRPWGDSAKHPRWKIFPQTPFTPDKPLSFRLTTILTS